MKKLYTNSHEYTVAWCGILSSNGMLSIGIINDIASNVLQVFRDPEETATMTYTFYDTDPEEIETLVYKFYTIFSEINVNPNGIITVLMSATFTPIPSPSSLPPIGQKIVQTATNEFEVRWCGISSIDNSLRFAVVNKTVATLLSVFDDLDETSKITYSFDDVEIEYDGYIAFSGIINQNDGSIVIVMKKPEIVKYWGESETLEIDTSVAVKRIGVSRNEQLVTLTGRSAPLSGSSGTAVVVKLNGSLDRATSSNSNNYEADILLKANHKYIISGELVSGGFTPLVTGATERINFRVRDSSNNIIFSGGNALRISEANPYVEEILTVSTDTLVKIDLYIYANLEMKSNTVICCNIKDATEGSKM